MINITHFKQNENESENKTSCKPKRNCNNTKKRSYFVKMDNPSQWLECTICREIMAEPRTLLCGHTFCRSCLQKLIDHAGNLKCPLDYKIFSVPDRDAGKLMRNYQLEGAIESSRRFATKQGKSARITTTDLEL